MQLNLVTTENFLAHIFGNTQTVNTALLQKICEHHLLPCDTFKPLNIVYKHKVGDQLFDPCYFNQTRYLDMQFVGAHVSAVTIQQISMQSAARKLVIKYHHEPRTWAGQTRVKQFTVTVDLDFVNTKPAAFAINCGTVDFPGDDADKLMIFRITYGF